MNKPLSCMLGIYYHLKKECYRLARPSFTP